jgi:hypothetical protein
MSVSLFRRIAIQATDEPRRFRHVLEKKFAARKFAEISRTLAGEVDADGVRA